MHQFLAYLYLLEFNSFLASGDFCCLLITFTNSLDPDQDRQNVDHDLDPNCLTLRVFLKDLLKKVIFKKVSRQQQKHEKLSSMQRVQRQIFVRELLCSIYGIMIIHVQ